MVFAQHYHHILRHKNTFEDTVDGSGKRQGGGKRSRSIRGGKSTGGNTSQEADDSRGARGIPKLDPNGLMPPSKPMDEDTGVEPNG